jgi:HK97 gp10 family phage protein
MAKKRGTKAGIESGKELAKNFRNIGKQVLTEEEQAVFRAALIVERDAKLNCPVDTGRLRQSIGSRIVEGDENNIIAEVGTNVTYAPYVEYGSSKMAARPFLFPAYNNNKQRILKELAKAFIKGCGL